MCDLLELTYSPLCDTSVKAYDKYIGAYNNYLKLASNHGCRIKQLGSYDGGTGRTRRDGGDNYARGDIGRAICGAVGAGGTTVVVDGVGASVLADQFDTVCGSIMHDGSSRVGVDGLATGDVGEGCNNLGSGVCDDSGERRGAHSQDRVRSLVGERRLGPNGGVSVGRGDKYEKNQLRRQRKKVSKSGVDSSNWRVRSASSSDSGQSGAEQGKVGGGRIGVRVACRMPTFDACDVAVRDDLQRTRAARLVAENKLRTFEMERKLELARAQDFEQLKQQQRTHLLRQTELNKVQIEKAHGSLSGEIAGSVPTVVGGTVETVLTGGSISPSSSISEAEIRKLHKDFLDSQAENEKLKKDIYKLRFGVHQDDEGRPDDSAPWDGGEDSVSQDQFSYRSGYMCTPEQREANKKLALELRGW